MTCGGVLPAYMPVVSACGTCPTCCATTVFKRTVEKKEFYLPWAHKLNPGWTLKSVVHTVKSATGASLTQPAYDINASYVVGATVGVNDKLYVSTAAVLPAQAPWIVGSPWTLQVTTKTDLYIVLDTDNKATEWIDKPGVATWAIVSGGIKETDYRVEAMATFRDCEGREVQFWDCVTVSIKDCN